MYDQNFRNQAVKECVNGQSMNATARKYGVSITALRAWISDYKDRMDEMKNFEETVAPVGIKGRTTDNMIKLKSVNIIFNGTEMTISKGDIERLTEILSQFD